PLPMLRLTVPPASCGRKVCRSCALRMPNFSMSLGRYVSTGLGPVSSAVGIFEPVTITRSTSATPEVPAPCANTFPTNSRQPPTLAAKATRTDPELISALISDPNGVRQAELQGFALEFAI